MCSAESESRKPAKKETRLRDTLARDTTPGNLRYCTLVKDNLLNTAQAIWIIKRGRISFLPSRKYYPKTGLVSCDIVDKSE